MVKPNPLQEQLLKAGLVKKSKVAEVAREQHIARHARAPATPSEIAQEAERVRSEKTERDRALAAVLKAQARVTELRAQARQIIEDKHVPGAGDRDYRFSADGSIRALLVDHTQSTQLASGGLVIARMGDRHVLLPRAASEKVRERDAGLIILDHGVGVASAGEPAAATASEDDAYYAQFKVPDDLVW